MSNMSQEQLKREAISLAQSVTGPAIIEWMQGWIDMEDNHQQHPMRDDQIKIGKIALKELGKR